MANPLDAFKNLKPWQQGAIDVGGAGVVGLVIWQKEKAKKAVPVTPATATQAATAGTAGEIEDPATGQYYPDDSVDPDSGLTYQQEITEYGSVSAADAAASGTDDQAALQGETPQEYDEQIGGTPAAGRRGDDQRPVDGRGAGRPVAAGLLGLRHRPGPRRLLRLSTPLGTSSDGTSLYTIMNSGRLGVRAPADRQLPAADGKHLRYRHGHQKAAAHGHHLQPGRRPRAPLPAPVRGRRAPRPRRARRYPAATSPAPPTTRRSSPGTTPAPPPRGRLTISGPGAINVAHEHWSGSRRPPTAAWRLYHTYDVTV